MYELDEAALLAAAGAPVTRQRGAVKFRGLVDVPEASVDFGLGAETVRSNERELYYRVADVELIKGDAVNVNGKTYRVAEEPKPVEDGIYAIALLKP